ncbi:MAG TPA: TonB-dependent receptor [Caulobacteraceae bacterium]
MSESLRLRSLLAMGVSAAAILGAMPALAQDATNSDQGTVVGEVVVTAQKREEAIQDVPIAVSAFSQDTLEKAKIDGGPNLVTAIPNVNFSKGNFTGYNFQIRGIGSKLVSGNADAGTGIHLNNAPLTANNLFEAEFYDVERVEVLRGPQGTLYGRNATGGVVNIITAKPVQDFEASIRGEIGNYNSRKLRAMVNIPINEAFALRAAGSILKRDGYGDNLVTGNDADDRDLYGARLSLAFTPSDTMRFDLMWDTFDEDDNRSRIGKQFCTKDPGPASIGSGPGSAAFPGGPLGVLERGYFSQGCQATSMYSPDVLGTPNTQGTLGGLFASLTGLQTGDAYAGKMQDPDVRNIESLFDPIYRAHTDVLEFNASWDLSDALQLTSLTSYSENELFTRQDYNRVTPSTTFNATPNPVNAYSAPLAEAYIAGAQAQTCGGLPEPFYSGCLTAVATNPTVLTNAANYYTGIYQTLFPGGYVSDPQQGTLNTFTTSDISSADTAQWTQEVRLQSNFDGPINFNVGGIYLDFRATGDYYVMFNTGTAYYQLNNLLNTGQVNCAGSTPGCVYIDPNETPDRSGHNYYDSYAPYHLKSKALFGEVYYQMTDALKWTLGLRYTNDHKMVEQHRVALGEDGEGPLGPPDTDPVDVKDVRFKETTGRFGVDWKPVLSFTDETLLYASYARGYKAGGVNPPCSFACTTYPSTYEPEFVDSIEVGAKNTLLAGSLVANFTGFSYDYKGYQVSKIVNRTSINENIDAKIKGLEFEGIWTPLRALRINTAVGFLDTEIGDSQSIDTFDRTGGDPTLTLVKADNASNCVASTAGVATVLNVINGTTGYPVVDGVTGNPYAILGICSGALAALGAIPSDGVAVDLNGKELPNAPKWTFSLGAQYTFEMGSWTVTPRADYYKQTDTFARIYNSDADKIDGWQNLNATLTFDNDVWGVSVEAFVKNATDEEAITDFYLTDDSSGLFRNAFFTEPRTYGLALTKRW